jgi:hypothetical protein
MNAIESLTVPPRPLERQSLAQAYRVVPIAAGTRCGGINPGMILRRVETGGLDHADRAASGRVNSAWPFSWRGKEFS